MKFLIIHGSFGSPEGNWFPRLKESLELLGQDVLVPRFPIDDWEELTKLGPEKAKKRDDKLNRQTLTNWLKVFEKQVLPWINGQKIVIIAHSLGPVFTLHALERFNLKVDAGIFVSPFLDLDISRGDWRIHFANTTFYKSDFDFKKLRKLMPMSYVLFSDNDPYVDTAKAKEFAKKLHSSIVLVKGAKHMNSEVNLNELPLVLELAKSRVDLSLYQKYLAYLSEYHPVEFVKRGKFESITLPFGKLAVEEGIFHFKNLTKRGLCTMPVTSIPQVTKEQQEYLDESRKCAIRGVPITRVYILNTKKDLSNKTVVNIMNEDAKAGIDVYYIFAKDVDIPKDKIDFGIWDDSYVCTVDHKTPSTAFTLDSTDKRMDEAKKHMQQILQKARKWEAKE